MRDLKHSGAPWVAHSKITQHFLADYEAESWTTAWIIRIDASYQTLHCYRGDVCGLAINDAISCLKNPVNCEACFSVRGSSRDALSEINARRLTCADFLFVFR